MKLKLKAVAIAAAIVWGGAIFMVSLGNMIWPPYGGAFLQMVASVYPGFDPASGGASIIIGTLWGLVDGAIAGLIFGWLYNKLSG